MTTFPGLGHQAGAEPIPLDRYRRNRRRRPEPAQAPAGGRDTGGSGRDGARGGAASGMATGLRIEVSVVSGVPVVSLDGRLDPGCIRECATTFAGVVRVRPRRIVLDLSRTVIEDDSVPVLGLLRRFAGRHGSKLVLAAVPVRAVEVLRRADVAPMYELQATVALAVDAATQEAHRSFPRG